VAPAQGVHQARHRLPPRARRRAAAPRGAIHGGERTPRRVRVAA
jgi:hypothetical protein